MTTEYPHAGLGAMRHVTTNGTQPEAARRWPDGATGPGAIARDLLARPDLGVTRISYVGLPERQAVSLVIDARHRGLHADVSRGASGRLSVRLSAAPEEAEATAHGGR